MTDIFETVLPRDDRGNDPNDFRTDPGYADEIDKRHRRYLGGQSSGEDASIKLTVICAADWQGRDVPAREWIWPEWLPRGTVTGLSGPPGVAKSTLAQQIATHLARGHGFLGKDIKAGTALYITCEDDAAELHRRQIKINAGLNIDMSDLKKLHLSSWVGEDAQLVRLQNGISERTERFHALDELMGDLNIDLVVLDLLADCWNGNECDRQAVNDFVKHHLAYFAQRHNAAVMGLFHPSLSGMASGSGTSGSTAWEGSFRSRLLLEKEEESDTRTLKRMKANYASLDETKLVWVDGYLRPESELSKSPTQEREKYFENAFQECLQYCDQKDIEVSPSPNSPHYYGRMFPALWTKMDGRRRKVTKEQFKKVYTSVVFDGAVKVEKDPREKKGDRLKFVGYRT